MNLIKNLWNPFETKSETFLLITGSAITLFGMSMSIGWGVIQDGVLDLHISNANAGPLLLAALLNITIMALLLWLCGKIINPKTRWIDIMNVVMVSRIWIYFNIPVIGNTFMKNITDDMMQQAFQFDPAQFKAADLGLMMLLSMLSLLFLIYFLIFMYNGFKVAVNANKGKHIVFYVLTVLMAELISKLLFYTIL